MVGDSFVEALQVPFDRSLGERLAAELGGVGHPVEVHRFGISGAPLSQYLQMTEREVVRYRPDWIVVLVVHNDFDESYKFKPGRYTSSFLKLRVEDGRVTGEIPPQPWRPGAAEWLRQTATARFFLYRWQVRPEFLVDLVLPRARAAGYAANTDIAAVLADRPGVEAVTDYLFGRIDAVVQAMGARLLVAMDGDRSAIYRAVDSPAGAQPPRRGNGAAAFYSVCRSAAGLRPIGRTRIAVSISTPMVIGTSTAMPSRPPRSAGRCARYRVNSNRTERRPPR